MRYLASSGIAHVVSISILWYIKPKARVKNLRFLSFSAFDYLKFDYGVNCTSSTLWLSEIQIFNDKRPDCNCISFMSFSSFLPLQSSRELCLQRLVLTSFTHDLDIRFRDTSDFTFLSIKRVFHYTVLGFYRWAEEVFGFIVKHYNDMIFYNLFHYYLI